MSNLHRILWIDSQIRNQKFPNCRTLSEKFEISSRQAARDIEYLRSSLGAPIQFDAARNGYRYASDTFILPAQYITEDEKQVLSYLSFRYSQNGGVNARRIAELFARLSGKDTHHDDQNGRTMPFFDISGDSLLIYRTLKESISAQKKVRLIYENAKGIRSERIFCPYLLFTENGTDYVVGYCEARDDLRVFRLNRIKSIAATGEPFRIVYYFDASRYDGGGRPFEMKSLYCAVLQTDDEKRLNELGIRTQRLDKAVLRVEFKDSKDFIQKLLQIETDFTVLSPKWLKDRFQFRIRNIYKNNFSHDILCPTPADILIPTSKSNETGGGKMKNRILEDIKMGNCWTSYAAAAYGCLKGAGLWQEDICRWMGMTGMAFHFIVHRQVCPSSVTVYDWLGEHSAMMDRIGIHSDAYQVISGAGLNTFELSRQDAVKRIEESIDNGVAVVLWAPTSVLEFGIVYGYDAQDQVFFVRDCAGQAADPLLYGNLGKSEVPILYYQIFKAKTEIDLRETYLASLRYALSEWNREYCADPNYGSGRKGYKNLIKAVESNDYNLFGLAYVLAVYKDSKRCAAEYLKFLCAGACGLKGLGQAAEQYSQLFKKYTEMSSLVPFPQNKPMSDCGKIPEVLAILRECAETEEQAMRAIEEAFRNA